MGIFAPFVATAWHHYYILLPESYIPSTSHTLVSFGSLHIYLFLHDVETRAKYFGVKTEKLDLHFFFSVISVFTHEKRL